MRTTVNLPDDLHRIALGIARDSRSSLSETVARLLRDALGRHGAAAVRTSQRTGLKNISLGRPVTSDDVRVLDDDE